MNLTNFTIWTIEQITNAKTIEEAKAYATSLAKLMDLTNSVGIKMIHKGDRLVSVIKVLRTVRPGLGLKEAKDLVESEGSIVFRGSQEMAKAALDQLKLAGATVELT